MNGISIEAGGKSYRLIFSTNALCALEEKLGSGVAEISASMADLGGYRLGKVRAMFWAALIDHHPETTLADAGRVIDQIGIVAASALVSRAMTQAFPPLPMAGPLDIAAANGGTGIAS